MSIKTLLMAVDLSDPGSPTAKAPRPMGSHHPREPLSFCCIGCNTREEIHQQAKRALPLIATCRKTVSTSCWAGLI